MTGDGWVVGKLVAAGPGYDARSKIILDLYLSECAAVAGPRRGEVASCQRAGLSPPTLQHEHPLVAQGAPLQTQKRLSILII